MDDGRGDAVDEVEMTEAEREREKTLSAPIRHPVGYGHWESSENISATFL